MIRLKQQCSFAPLHGDVFSPGRAPSGVQRLHKDWLALEADDAARAAANRRLYNEYNPVMMDAPKHFTRWVGTDEINGFGSGDVERMHIKYKQMKSLVQDARREVTALGEQVRGGSTYRVTAAEKVALSALHHVVNRMVREAENDLATLTLRANETAVVCKTLRVEDIDEATGRFRYVPEQLLPHVDTMGIPERDEHGNPKTVKPFSVSVRWFGRAHTVTAKNRVQFAGLQKLFYQISGHMFTLRTRHVEPRLGELTVLHRCLDAIVTGEVNKADGWPVNALEKHIDNIPQPYIGPVDPALANPAFEALATGQLAPFAEDWDVWKFWTKSEEYWRPELARLENRVTVYHRRGRGVLLEAEGKLAPLEKRVAVCRHRGRGVLLEAEGFRPPLSREEANHVCATTLGPLIKLVTALHVDRPVVRAISARAAEALEKRPQGWVTDVFTTPARTLHCTDDWSRNGVFDGYQVLHDRTKNLAQDMLVTQRMLANIIKSLQKRVKALAPQDEEVEDGAKP